MNNAASFNDILKKSILKVFDTSQFSTQDLFLTLLVATVCGIIIFSFYKLFYKGVVYSHNFSILLIMMTMVTSFIIITISSNIVLSLGMVGALSIVRFRAAIKDPIDLGFLFWAVATGIAAGARLYMPTLAVTMGIGLVYMLSTKLRSKSRVYLLVVRFDNRVNEDVQRVLFGLKWILKNKTGINQKTELTLELKLKGTNTAFVTKLSDIEGVESAVLVEYSGDYAE